MIELYYHAKARSIDAKLKSLRLVVTCLQYNCLPV